MNMFVCTRTKKFPEGIPNLNRAQRKQVTQGNVLMRKAMQLATRASLKGIPVSIENPKSSCMWHTQVFKAFQRRCKPQRFDFDMCRFGAYYRKRTTIFTTNGLDLQALALRCNCTKPHKNLSGWVAFKGEKRMTTKSATAYPTQLCECWARCVAMHLGQAD